MSNPLFNALGNGSVLPQGMSRMIQQFQQFKRTFSGDPRQQVQQMLNSGRVSQNDYNRAVQMANELYKMMR